MLESNLRKSLEKILVQYQKLQHSLEDEKVTSDIKKYTKITRQMAEIEDIITHFKEYLHIEEIINGAKQILKTEDNNELLLLAKSEIAENEPLINPLIKKLKVLLIPQDPLDKKNIIVEIRGAAGGDEANIFAGDLFRMYHKWSDHLGLNLQVLERQFSSSGDLSLVVFQVAGQKPYSKFKFETGSHRVQRIPETESSGRIHTSTAVVTVLPQADKQTEIVIRPQDIKIDVFRSSGAGGQSVNTTDSAVRITHLESKIVVTSQDERSQIQNKEKALTILKTKLYNRELEMRAQKEGLQRKMAGSGDRSEKIRTYNYPQNRVTDHRIHFSVNSLDKVMEGHLDQIVEALIASDQAAKIKGQQ